MNEKNKIVPPSQITEDHKHSSHTNANTIKTHLKLLVEELPPPIAQTLKPDPKLKENSSQKNAESPILKIAKKQKSKQVAEMIFFESPDSKINSINSFNSIENESISPETSPKKPFHQTPEPQKSTHKVSRSTFLQHKYLENLVSKPQDSYKTKPFTINLNPVNNVNVINEVDSVHEETPNNNLNFKFHHIVSKKQKTKKEETNDNSKKQNNYSIKDKGILIKKNEKNELDSHPFRHLIFSPKISENLFKKHLLITYKGVIYSQKLQNPSESFLESRSIILPESQ